MSEYDGSLTLAPHSGEGECEGRLKTEHAELLCSLKRAGQCH